MLTGLRDNLTMSIPHVGVSLVFHFDDELNKSRYRLSITIENDGQDDTKENNAGYEKFGRDMSHL